MINIDEISVNKSLKVDHSWIVKGESRVVFFPRPISIVMVILSTKQFLHCYRMKLFIRINLTFLENLNSWININKTFGFYEALFLMNN